MRLANRAAAADIQALVQSDPRLKLKVLPEDTYWANQASGMATFIRVLGLFVVFIFSIGAALGAMITMYAQVAARIRELGTLRAVGFRRRSVLASVLVESALLGTAGGLLGALAALGMRWVKFRTLNFQTFSEITFSFVPSPEILLAAVGFGAAMGFFGGLLPSLRAARLGVLDALRA
jgi:ABC-type antimicrobial peptide transport system permease subunit